MSEFSRAKSHFSDATTTINTLLDFFLYYKSLQDEVSIKLSSYISKIDATDQCSPIKNSLDSLVLLIKNNANSYSEFSQYFLFRSLSSLLIEPLSQYTSTFEEGYTNVFNSLSNASTTLQNSRIGLEELKNNYLKASVKAEKAAKMAKIEEDEERINLACRNHDLMKGHMIKASEDYLTALAKEKELWGEYIYNKKDGIEYLKDLEESRLQFLKRSLEKYCSIESKFQISMADHLIPFQKSVSEIVPLEESQKFQKGALNFEDISREAWVSYEQWKESLKNKGQNPLISEEDYISSEVDYKPMDSSIALMKSLLYSIIPSRRKQSSDSSSTDRSTLMDTPGLDSFEHDNICDFSKKLMDPSQWENFLIILESRKYIGYMEKTGINTLAALISTIISLMMDKKLFKVEYFYKIVTFSHSFYTVENKRMYLFYFIKSHPIFQNLAYWVKTLNFAITSKLSSEKILFKKNQERLKKKGKKPQKSNKNSSKSTVSSILSQFNFYMTNLGTTIEICSKVIIECGIKAKIGSDRLFPLVSELHSIQTEATSIISKHKSLRSNSKLRSKWGKHLPLGLLFEYLQISEMCTVLTVCKHWFHLLSSHYYKEALLKHGNTSFRKLAWASVLYKPGKDKYLEILEGLKKNPASIKDLEDVIHMDVYRSYSTNSNVNSQHLEEILKAYAFYRKKVGYCQGMHYLAGTMSQVLGHGEVSFWAIDEIVRVHQMQDLYGQDMSKLRTFFYILERILTLHHPELRVLLNAENIVSSNYSASWFITLFAGQLSSRMDLLLKIWDHFIYVIIT